MLNSCLLRCDLATLINKYVCTCKHVFTAVTNLKYNGNKGDKQKTKIGIIVETKILMSGVFLIIMIFLT